MKSEVENSEPPSDQSIERGGEEVSGFSTGRCGRRITPLAVFIVTVLWRPGRGRDGMAAIRGRIFLRMLKIGVFRCSMGGKDRNVIELRPSFGEKE